MPVGISSPARNLFLLGSSGSLIDNFFKLIDQSSTTNNYYQPSGIIYDDSDGKYVLAGTAKDQNLVPNKDFGWFEKRDYDSTTDPANPTSTTDWDVRVESSSSGVNTVLRDIKTTSTTLYVVGKTSDIPWIAKYNSTGVEQWTSTSNTADVEYRGVSIDSNGNAYACGNTNVSGEAVSFVEKFDSSGTPGWGTEAFMLGRDVALTRIAANTRGEVVAAGFIEDDTADKGYVVKIDTTTGQVLWDRTLSFTDKEDGTSKNVRINDIKIDDNDRIYIAGEVGINAFVVKYTPEGNLLWQKQTGYAFDLIGVEISHRSLTVNSVTQDVTVASNFASGGIVSTFLSNYNRAGDLIWRREVSQGFSGVRDTSLDNEGSFIFLIFDPGGSVGDQYTFGKVSATGNGLGNFQYDDGTTTALINYNYQGGGTLADDVIGRLSDGSVRNDISDFVTYPFGANNILFDDLSTLVANKKRQLDSADTFEYDNGSAIRIAPRQETNLLGDVYSGSGDWLDQSGNGNDATTVSTITTTTTTGGTTESENFGTGGSITYDTYGTVVEGVTATLPYSTSDWDHYNSKVRDLQSGGFKITMSNSATTDFFIGCWVKFETYQQSRQMGINLSGNYVYWETLVNGKVAVRHNGGSRQDSTSGTGIDDGNWHYISLSRTGNTLTGHVDGSPVVSTTGGVSGNSVPTNADFWFFGGSGTSYNIDGKILDPIINIGTGTSGGYTKPTKPIIDSSGNFNGGGGGSGPFFSSSFEYASPAIAFAGTTTTTTTTNTVAYNAAGKYFEFDGTDDYISGSSPILFGTDTGSIEAWFKTSDTSTPGGAIYSESQPGDNTYWGHLRIHGGKPRFVIDDDSVVPEIEANVTVSDGAWHHIVVTGDGSNYAMYVDGESYTPTYANGSGYKWFDDTPGLTTYTIGALERTSVGNYFNGEIGEVRIYSRALTAAQAFQNYNATKETYTGVAASTDPGLTSTRTP